MRKHYSFIFFIVFVFLFSGCGSTVTQRATITPSATPKDSQILKKTLESTPAPSIMEVASPGPSAEPTFSNHAISFNEDNLPKYFPFGMTGNDLGKELTELGIESSGALQPNGDEPVGFTEIIAEDDFIFHLDDHNRLFSMDHISLDTAKGLESGDSIEQMHALYGKEDEYDAIQDEYVYSRNGYVFIVDAGFPKDNDKVIYWSISVNKWNYPDISTSNESMKPLHGDNTIQFNENSFFKYFKFGMSKKAVENRLNELGVRITTETTDDFEGGGCWVIQTDHVYFSFDQNEKLICIDTEGWATAKGLEIGGTVDTLHKLYGKESRFNDDGPCSAGYIYYKKGYRVEYNFYDNLLDGWSLYGPGSVI